MNHAKPPRDERKYTKVWRVPLTKDEMDVMAAVAGRYFDSMAVQKVALPAKISLDALTALNKFKRAIISDSPMVMIDGVAPELQEAALAINGGAHLQTDAIDDALADPSVKTIKQLLDELERRIVSHREEAQRAKVSAPQAIGTGMAIGYFEALKEIRDWLIGGHDDVEKNRSTPISQ